jgi:hypothetical protein
MAALLNADPTKVIVTDDEAGAIDVPILPPNIHYLLSLPPPKGRTVAQHREDILWDFNYASRERVRRMQLFCNIPDKTRLP